MITIDIDNQLDNLNQGRYVSRKDNGYAVLDIQIEPADRKIYADLRRNISIDVKVWVYHDLEQEISILLESFNSFTYIFDVTSVLKSQLVDIYVSLKVKGVNTIHSFELFNERSYDYRDLIHNLHYEKNYSYPCLAESTYTKDKIVANANSVISNSDFDQLQSELKTQKNECSHLENLAVNYFARFWSLIYFLAGLPFFIWLCRYLLYQPEGWNKIEPIVFITTFGWFLLNYVLQSLFKGEFPSLDPRESFKALRDWKKRQLNVSKTNSSNRP